jgi:hypothetical protein
MKKLTLVASFVVSLALMMVSMNVVQSQVGADQSRRDRLSPRGGMEDEDQADLGQSTSGATEAPTGFDNLTNGFSAKTLAVIRRSNPASAGNKSRTRAL